MRHKFLYATLEISGTQLIIEPGRFYDVNYIPGKIGDIITLDKVLLSEFSTISLVGKPYLKNVKIYAVLLKHLRSRKTIVYKMRPKKKTRKKQGHRQNLTRVQVIGVR